eukprot:g41052.t1
MVRETQPCSSSDSDFDDDEPRKFHVEIKPVTVKDWASDQATSVEQLRASIGNIVLSSNPTIPSKRNSTRHSIQLAPLAVEGNPQGIPTRGSYVPMQQPRLRVQQGTAHHGKESYRYNSAEGGQAKKEEGIEEMLIGGNEEGVKAHDSRSRPFSPSNLPHPFYKIL